MRLSLPLLLAAAGIAHNAGAADAVIALHCGHLFDANAGKLLGETTIIIDGKRIKEVKTGPRRRAGRADRRAWRPRPACPA